MNTIFHSTKKKFHNASYIRIFNEWVMKIDIWIIMYIWHTILPTFMIFVQLIKVFQQNKTDSMNMKKITGHANR